MSGKVFAGSVFVSLLGMGLISMFALPLLYPSLQTNLQDDDIGIVLQSKYIERSSQAQIVDSATTSWVDVPDTKMNITIETNSRIYALFNSMYVLGVSNSLDSDRVAFNISLQIEGVGQRISRISYFEMGTYSDMREFSSTFTLNYMTEELTAGTYPGNNYLLFSTPSANFTRTLVVQELSE
jgi:hypothetical protein